MSLNVNPDTEARLLALAQASGVSVDDFLQHIVEEKTGQAPIGPSSSLSPAERAAAWRESIKDLPQSKPLSDEEISRESIYSERG